MKKKVLVLKLGSHVLTRGKTKISKVKILDVAQQLELLKHEYNIIVVSSGAIAAAKAYLKQKGTDLSRNSLDKQSMSAIGQPMLMRIYNEVFECFHTGVAQCLLTYSDFDNKVSRENTLNLFEKLWAENYIPIINENDAIATEEIKFGDNDKLAALTARLVNAEILVLASDINGMYTDDPKENPEASLINQINDLSPYKKYIKDSKSSLGTGGMTSKFIAADICLQANVEMKIVNGMNKNFLIDALTYKSPHTTFVSDKKISM